MGYPQLDRATGKRYNSICVVAPDQTVEATYQKHFLYETDELWAEEGPAFRAIRLAHLPQVGTVGLGICMVGLCFVELVCKEDSKIGREPLPVQGRLVRL